MTERQHPEIEKLRIQTAREIIDNHTRQCNHKFVMVEDLKERLIKKRIVAHGDPARLEEVRFIDELLGDLK